MIADIELHTLSTQHDAAPHTVGSISLEILTTKSKNNSLKGKNISLCVASVGGRVRAGDWAAAARGEDGDPGLTPHINITSSLEHKLRYSH